MILRKEESAIQFRGHITIETDIHHIYEMLKHFNNSRKNDTIIFDWPRTPKKRENRWQRKDAIISTHFVLFTSFDKKCASGAGLYSNDTFQFMESRPVRRGWIVVKSSKSEKSERLINFRYDWSLCRKIKFVKCWDRTHFNFPTTKCNSTQSGSIKLHFFKCHFDAAECE